VHPPTHRKPPRVLRRVFLLVAPLALSVFSLGPASAVSRCTDAKGKVTFQDAACDATATAKGVDTSDAFSTRPKAASPGPGARLAGTAAPATDPGTASGDYATARGTWRGPVQFQITVGGVRDIAAQAVTAAVLDIRPTGEVAGVIPSAGCKLSGLAREFVTPNSATLDVSLKGCDDPRFNRRFTGHLISNVKAKEASLQLNAIAMPLLSGKSQQASLDAVFKR